MSLWEIRDILPSPELGLDVLFVEQENAGSRTSVSPGPTGLLQIVFEGTRHLDVQD